MDVREAANAIDTELVHLIEEAELWSAHHREFVPDGVPAPVAVQAALDAAVQGGIAIGLQRARDVVAAVVG